MKVKLKRYLILLTILLIIIGVSFDIRDVVSIPVYFVIGLYILLPNQKNY